MDLSVQTRNRSYKPRLLKEVFKQVGPDFFIFRAENSFYKISNLKLSNNPLKTLKKKKKLMDEARKKLRLNCRWSLHPWRRLECSES